MKRWTEKDLNAPADDQDIYILTLVKGQQRYLILFNESRKAEALRTMGRWATNPQLDFTWYDAACLSRSLRNMFTSDAGLDE